MLGKMGKQESVPGLGLGDIFQRVGARFTELFTPLSPLEGRGRRRSVYEELSPAQQKAVRRRRAANKVARRQRHVNAKRGA